MGNLERPLQVSRRLRPLCRPPVSPCAYTALRILPPPEWSKAALPSPVVGSFSLTSSSMPLVSWSLWAIVVGLGAGFTVHGAFVYLFMAGVVGLGLAFVLWIWAVLTGRVDPFPLSSPVTLRIQIVLPPEGKAARGEGANSSDGQQRVLAEAKRNQVPPA